MSAMITKHTPGGHSYMIEVVSDEKAAKGWVKTVKTTAFVIAAILGYI